MLRSIAICSRFMNSANPRPTRGSESAQNAAGLSPRLHPMVENFCILTRRPLRTRRPTYAGESLCCDLFADSSEAEGTHGAARHMPWPTMVSWSVVGVDTNKRAAITLKLESNKDTKRKFPFDFELTFVYELREGQLRVHQTYENKTNRPMPMYAGFHPYFLTLRKRLRYQTDATHYFDYNDETDNGFTGVVDLTDKVESVVFTDAKEPRISFELPDGIANKGRTIGMDYGREFKYVVLWSVPGKPFVCVEPWMALSGSLHTGQGLTLVNPGHSLTTHITFRA